MNNTTTKILFFSIAMLLALQSSAQNNYKKDFKPQHEFRVGIGAFNSLPYSSFDGYYDDYYWGNGGFTSDNYEKSLYSYDSRITSGAISVAYSYNALYWLSVGASFTYAGVYQNQYDRITTQKVGKKDSHNFMLIPTARFTYLQRPFVRLYSALGVGLGLSRTNESNRDTNYIPRNDYVDGGWYVPVQFTFFGMSIGHKLFGYTELGAGAKGVFIIGMGYKFNAEN